MPTNEILFCSECSVAVGESPVGTAPRVDVWLLLEHNANWGAKALPASNLDAAVKQQIETWIDALPNARFQFIKRGRNARRDESNGHHFYIARSDERQPTLHRFLLASYDDLLTLDVPAIANGDPAYDMQRTDEQLLITCTNGQRDIACSKYGMPLYVELERRVGTAAWQTTHFTGHRFSPVFASLPDGTCYGHARPDEFETLLSHCQRDEIMLARLRGRSCYDPPVQAADYFLRAQQGLAARDAVRLVSVAQPADQQWTVCLQTRDGALQRVTVEQYLPDFRVYKGSADPEPRQLPQWRLVSINPA